MLLILQSIVLIDYCHYIQEVAKTRHFEYIINYLHNDYHELANKLIKEAFGTILPNFILT